MYHHEIRQDWLFLKEHQKKIASHRIQDWFDQDEHRFKKFSLYFNELFLDYSKNRVTSETIELLCRLGDSLKLADKIDALFSGHIVNFSEKKPALHTALRDYQNPSLLVDGHNVMNGIRHSLNKVATFTEQIRTQTWTGCTGQPLSDIVNVGIGGSHLGPLMATHALNDLAQPNLAFHTLSNIDSAHLRDILKKINPEKTLFIISSKSFTTLETMTHANTLRNWLENQLGQAVLAKHFVAVTAAPKLALQFGIPEENIFELWDWVGGRYSIWSAIGLSLALMIGMPAFYEFLDGAAPMDRHLKQQPFSQNMPVLLALLSIWYINFFNASHHAIIPYSHHLHYFRLHLQQLEMESNGKNINELGQPLDFLTAPVILGEQGCNGQHAFHQLLHQGQHFIPVDFILTGKKDHSFSDHHDILIGSALSQAQALMRGKTTAEAEAELRNEGYSDEVCRSLAKHKSVPGNRPSTTLFLDKITPFNLGSLLALYEHKTFVQGAIWQINSFDQWGVELGKKMLPSILEHFNVNPTTYSDAHDSSTQGLIDHYNQLRNSLCRKS